MRFTVQNAILKTALRERSCGQLGGLRDACGALGQSCRTRAVRAGILASARWLARRKASGA